MTQARITKFSLTDSPRTLVYAIKSDPEIRKGSPRARALNESGVGKIHNFQPISRPKQTSNDSGVAPARYAHVRRLHADVYSLFA